MYHLIDFVMSIFNKLVLIMNMKVFPDADITYLQLILGCIAIKYVIKFLFGGFKEVDTSSNFLTPKIAANIKGISNSKRKQQIVDIKKYEGTLEGDILKEAYRK